MFGIGSTELVLILVFGFLIFGPDKLPSMAKTLGRAIAKFRKAQSEMSDVIKNEVYNPDEDDPFKNPLDAFDKASERAKSGAAEIKKAGQEAKAAAKSNAAQKAAAKAGSKPGTAKTTEVKPGVQGESFSERKARYDKMRAERQAAQKAAEPGAGATGGAAGAVAAAAKPAVSAEELYGNKKASDKDKADPAAAAAPTKRTATHPGQPSATAKAAAAARRAQISADEPAATPAEAAPAADKPAEAPKTAAKKLASAMPKPASAVKPAAEEEGE